MSDYEPEMITVSLAEWNANVSRLAALVKDWADWRETCKAAQKRLLEEQETSRLLRAVNIKYEARIAALEEEVAELKAALQGRNPNGSLIPAKPFSQP